PTRPTPSRTGLIIAIVLVTLLLIVGGGAAAGYWFLIVVPEHDEYLRMVQASRQRFQEAKQDYADGKLSDEDYLTRLQGALAFVYDALNKDNRGIEAQQEQDEINAERDRISLKIDQAKTKAEAAFHELYNQGMLKEAAAKSEASEAAGIALWRQAGDLYSKAHDLRPQDSGPADGFARAKKKLDEYAARMNEDLQQQLSAAQSLEKSAADESDLAKQRQLWLDAGAAYEKIRAIAPDHPAIAPGVARVKAGLDDIKAREEGEVNMLVLAAQVAADRGSVAKDPARAMEDWTAAVNGFEKAVVLRPKDQAIRTKRDNAVKKKAQLENYFALMQEGANQAHKFYRAHTIAEMKATAIACKKAVEDAAAIFSDDTTPGMLEAARSFSGQADQCERALTMMANDEQWNAAVLMDKVTTADANLAFAWFTWGQCLVQLDADQDPLDAEERDKIADKFNRATGIDPQYAEAWFAWGKMLEHAEPELDPGADPDETAGVALEHATVKYGKAAEADPKMTEAWLAWARGLTAGYSNGLAYFAVQKALALDPKNADAWVLAGTICNEMYCYEQACDNFEKAAGLAPERAVIWHDWAEALNETDRPAEAAVKMRKAADLAADTAEIQAEYKTRAASLDLAATLQKAQADEAKRLIALADAKVISADEYCTLLRDLRALRRLKEAGERAHAAIVAFPGSAAAWDLWAGILYDQNDYEGAAKKEETAVAVDGENKAYAEAWNTYKEEADGEATTRENFAGYAKALEADPHDVAALESWASDLYVLHNSDEAKVKIQRGLEMDPHNSALLQLQYQIQESQRVDARRGK
ncbi:MAG TPA: hypothetical protein VL860_02260, partial [Planctomycetota bacterium]|nr:hypothetical protein [Planctomycetota bacterium]